MTSDTDRLKGLYDHFNARDVDAAIAAMHHEVVWANGIEGGFVHGLAAVRAYWARQWAELVSRADPLDFSVGADGTIQVKVHLSARNMHGEVVFDMMGVHAFHMKNGLVRRFDILSVSGGAGRT
jgi:hypothetical protein